MKRLLFLTGISVIFFLAACKSGGKEEHVHEVKEEYTCPMHPDIIRNEPGTCPICGMDLVKKESGGQKTGHAELEALLKPSNTFVVSAIPVTAMQKREEQTELDVLGRITYDTRRTGTIATITGGRIEKLYVRYRYQKVSKGQRIMDIYSPDLLTAQQNLLFLQKNDPENASLIQAARQKLLLMGMSESQLNEVVRSGKPYFSVAVYSKYNGHIHEAGEAGMKSGASEDMASVPVVTEDLLIKEGMYVQKGQSVFEVYDPGRAWAVLNIFADQQSLVKKGNAVRIVPETAPDKDFRGVVDYIEPFYRPENKTLTVRVYFDNHKLQIPIGSQVRAVVFGDSKDAYWLPGEAVLSLGMDKVVFVKDNGGFRAHKVNTGIIHKEHIQITGNLNPEDSVAVNAQFLMDSESFIKTGL